MTAPGNPAPRVSSCNDPRQGRRPAGNPARLPKLLSFLGVNALAGATVGLLVVVGLLVTNTFDLKDLISTTSDPVSALLTITVMFMLTFASLTMGTAVMLLPWGIHRGNPFAKLFKRPTDDES